MDLPDDLYYSRQNNYLSLPVTTYRHPRPALLTSLSGSAVLGSGWRGPSPASLAEQDTCLLAPCPLEDRQLALPAPRKLTRAFSSTEVDATELGPPSKACDLFCGASPALGAAPRLLNEATCAFGCSASGVPRDLSFQARQAFSGPHGQPHLQLGPLPEALSPS